MKVEILANHAVSYRDDANVERLIEPGKKGKIALAEAEELAALGAVSILPMESAEAPVKAGKKT